MNINHKLDSRLKSAIAFVRNGDVIADIGTDHGYIPVFLIKENIIPFAYATDINAMPLNKAKENSISSQVDDKIDFHLCNGLDFIDQGSVKEEYPIDDIIICGMGGELIVNIIERSGYPKHEGVRLILQPMTMSDKLRLYLVNNGFNITDEILCEAAGKIYTVISAEFTGKNSVYTDLELIIGKKNIEKKDKLLKKILKLTQTKYETIIKGMEIGGYNAIKERALLNDIKTLIEQQGADS